MIKNTLDIVNRARELADLQNSDFIGWKENNNLLNEAYTKLYTELINHKDRFYIKSISPNDLELDRENDNERFYKLPEDFYMLNNITRGVNCEQILRKAPAESKTSYRYDIINNCLVLYGGVEQTDLTMEYWTIPETLSIKAPTKNIILPEGWTWCDCNDNKYVGYKYNSSTQRVTVLIYDIKTQVSIEKEINYSFISAPVSILLSSNVIVISGNANISGSTYFIHYAYNFFTEAYQEFQSEISYGSTVVKMFVGKSNGILYILSQGKQNDNLITAIINLNKYSANGFPEETGTLLDIEYDITSESGINKYFTFNKNDYDNGKIEFYFPKINDNNIYELWKLTKNNFEFDRNINIYISSQGNRFIPQFYNDNLYYLNGNAVCRNDEELLPTYDVKAWLGVNKEDNSTGYGYSVIDYSGNVYVYSTLKDTEIEFPNNFYFQYLSYMLAIAYKAKQNADSTALKDQATEESRQFYNSISQDANQELRIKNVYNMGGWL